MRPVPKRQWWGQLQLQWASFEKTQLQFLGALETDDPATARAACADMLTAAEAVQGWLKTHRCSDALLERLFRPVINGWAQMATLGVEWADAAEEDCGPARVRLREIGESMPARLATFQQRLGLAA